MNLLEEDPATSFPDTAPFVPFGERNFVGEHTRNTESAITFPDNRPLEPRVFFTKATTITRGELDDKFHELHTPWKDQVPCYTVKDWRRSVAFRTLPPVPKPSDIALNARISPRNDSAPATQRTSMQSGGQSRGSSNGGKTPYLNMSPLLKTPGRPQKGTPRRGNKSTPRNRRISRQTTPRSSTGKEHTPRDASGNISNGIIAGSSDRNVLALPKTVTPQKHKKIRPQAQINQSPTIEDFEQKSLNCLSRGKPFSAIGHQRSAIDVTIKTFGLSSQRIRASCERFIVLCNSIAMGMINGKRAELAYEILEKALAVSTKSGPMSRHANTRKRMRAATLNNMGCYWKSRREYGQALRFLQKAASLEAKTMGVSAEADSPARTHLNLCSVLSALGRHAQALDHACVAKKVLEVDRRRFVKAGGSEAGARQKFAQLRVVALHNMAVEEMWLFRYANSRVIFEQALAAVDEVPASETTGLTRLREEISQGLEEASMALEKEESSVIRVREKKASLKREPTVGVK